MVRNQKFDLTNYAMRIFFFLDYILIKVIAKLGIDHVLCEEIGAMIVQFIICHSFFPPIEVIETRLVLFLNLFYHGFRT